LIAHREIILPNEVRCFEFLATSPRAISAVVIVALPFLCCCWEVAVI
jgi:hypothetical protein